MRTSNPALSEKAFQGLVNTGSSQMTIRGTVNKSLLLLGIVILAAAQSWKATLDASQWGNAPVPGWYIPLAIISLIVAIAAVFKKTWSPFLAPTYALFEGLLIGCISALFEASYPGIALQAVLCTMGTFLALLIAYQSRWIQATPAFQRGVIAATGGIFVVYLIDMVMRMFGWQVPFIHETGPLGMLISVGITIVAALNLILDFNFIEEGARAGAPKYMEWYSAFGLLVTLIWLYLEILNLLAKSRRR